MYDNNPMSVLNFGLEFNLNNVDGHKYLISGTEEDIQEVTADTLYACYDTFYTPSNMFLVLTGKFLPLEALAIVKEVEAKREDIKKKKITRRAIKEPVEVACDYESREMDVSIPKLKIAYKLEKSKFKDYSDLELKVYFDAIISAKFGVISDLYESLTSEGLALYGMYPFREVRDDYILLSFEVETDYKEQVIDSIRNELKNIKISEEELDMIRKANISSAILHFNDIIDVAQDIQDDVLSNGKIVEDTLDLYENMDLKKINDIASKIKLNNESIYYIDRLEDKPTVNEEQ